MLTYKGFYPQITNIFDDLKTFMNLLLQIKTYLSVSTHVFRHVQGLIGKSQTYFRLKTLFNIVEERFKKLLNFDVSAV